MQASQVFPNSKSDISKHLFSDTESDTSSSANIPRKRPAQSKGYLKGLKLIRASDVASRKIEIPDSENPLKKQFYEHYDAKYIPENHMIRTYWSDKDKCFMTAMCRDNGGSRKITTLKWSTYEGSALLKVLENFLECWENHPESETVLEMFKNQPERLYENAEENWSTYWEDPDFASENIRLRWCRKKSTNQYSAILHTPVRADRRIKNWCGPQLYVPFDGIKMLAFYLHCTLEDLAGKSINKAGKPSDE